MTTSDDYGNLGGYGAGDGAGDGAGFDAYAADPQVSELDGGVSLLPEYGVDAAPELDYGDAQLSGFDQPQQSEFGDVPEIPQLNQVPQPGVDDGFNPDPTPAINPEDFGMPADGASILQQVEGAYERQVEGLIGKTAYGMGQTVVNKAEEIFPELP